MTIVMATHDMAQGQSLTNRIAVLMNGEILQVGSPEQIFYLPKSLEIAEFVGVENVLHGKVIEKDDALITLQVNGTSVQVVSNHSIGDDVYVFVRPEEVTFTLSTDRTSARNVFNGRITQMIQDGPLIKVEVDCGFKLRGVITRRSANELGFSVGKEVYASFKATAVHSIKRFS
jgi:molybdate/tungstate transport system ATP-binding protein